MTLPINSLMNMEFQLYGGLSGANSNCPSYLNGYRSGNVNFYGNPYYNQRNYYAQNDAISINKPQLYDTFASHNNNTNSQPTNFQASQSDLDVLTNYYLKGMAPSESITSAAIGGGAFGLLNNMRLVAHPWNSAKTIGSVEKMFADVKKEGSELYKLYRDPKTYGLMKDAYGRMHKLACGTESRLPIIKSKIDKSTYEAIKAEMEAALKSGNKEAIAIATEKARIASQAHTGYLSRGVKWSLNKTKSGLNHLLPDGMKFNTTSKTVAEKLADTSAIKTAATKSMSEGGLSLGKQIAHSFKGQGLLGGGIFAGIEFLLDWGNIKSAFKKDNDTGMKQLGQTSVKAAGSIVGWTVGEAIGTWGGAKLGALAGTAICPGVGTAIGAVAGLIGGSIGCALMGKLTHSLVGNDAGAIAKADELKKSPQGVAELLQITASQAQNDKKLDPRVLKSLENVASLYA